MDMPLWYFAQTLLADLEAEKRSVLNVERDSYNIRVVEDEIRERQMQVIVSRLREVSNDAR